MEQTEYISPLNEEIMKNLPNWKKKPKLADLKTDLTSVQSSHSAQKTKIQNWLDNLNVEGAAKVNTPAGSSKVVPKLIRKQAEWRYASLSEAFFSTSDLFNVKPVTWEDKEASEQNQLLLNYQFQHAIDKQKFIDEYVRTAVDEGTVILRTGWRYEEAVVEEDVPVAQFIPDPSYEQVLQEIAAMRQSSPSQFQTDVPEEMKMALQMYEDEGIPYRPQIVEMKKEKRTKAVKNHPTVEVCDFRNVLIDPTCNGDIKKAQFVIYMFETSMSELKKDKRYVNLEHVKPNNTNVLSQPDYSTSEQGRSFEFSDEARKKVVVYEYWGFWDYDDSGIAKPIVVSWVGDTIIRMDESPFPDGELPFVVVQYLPVRREIYGEPDGALLEDNQKILGAVTRGMIDILAKSANAQTGYMKGFLDTTNKRKFEKGEDYEFNNGMVPAQSVFMHTFNEIPMSAMNMVQMQTLEAESLTGVKAYSQGLGSQSLGDVAAGIRGALDAASKRELGILRRLSAGICEVGRKFIAMNSEFLSEEEVIRVTNMEFQTIKRDDLAGKFDLELSISTAEEDNNKAEQLAFMLQTMGPNMPMDFSQMILADIAKLRKMPDLAHKIKTYQPQPDPVQEMVQKIEIQKLQLELAKLEADISKVQSDAQLSQARAQEVAANADLKTLDFVEQESGVKQERDLQKQGAQAQAQTQMKLIEHDLKLKEKSMDAITKLRIEREKLKKSQNTK